MTRRERPAAQDLERKPTDHIGGEELEDSEDDEAEDDNDTGMCDTSCSTSSPRGCVVSVVAHWRFQPELVVSSSSPELYPGRMPSVVGHLTYYSYHASAVRL